MHGSRRSPEQRRHLVELAYAHAVSVVQPGSAVRRVLGASGKGFTIGHHEVKVGGRLVVIAVGKAATPMAAAALEILRDRIDTGIVLTKDGHFADAPETFLHFEAAHPVPDERGINATRAILEAVSTLDDQDVVLALISGGGSALLESPREELTLWDIQQTTDLLLRAGAPIHDLNAVRSELSEVKGGGLRRAIGKARTVSLLLSDVLGNDPEVIASGPTIAREANPGRALQLLSAYELLDRVPARVVGFLNDATSRPDRFDGSSTDHDLFEIIGDNAQFVVAVGGFLEGRGLTVRTLWSDREGEARECAAEWVQLVHGTDVDVAIGGGELTVMVRGNGVGGRNTEFALAAVPLIHAHGMAMTVASLASDGQDGAADAAGAIVDETTAPALRARGVDVQAALDANDSATALDSVRALVSPGPTGTNVNDVYVAIR